MIQKDFEKYWKEKRKNKYFSKCVPNFNKKKTFENINELLKVDDFRKLNYEDRILILRKIFGNPREQFKDIEKELKKSIEVGYSVKIKKAKR